MDGNGGINGMMIITSDEMDHSRKFPAFSSSKIRDVELGELEHFAGLATVGAGGFCR